MPARSAQAKARHRLRSWEWNRRVNSKRQCDVFGCGRFRGTRGCFCPTHHNRWAKYGHPEGQPVTAKELALYRRLWLAHERRYKDHAGLQAARDFLVSLARSPISYGINDLTMLRELRSLYYRMGRARHTSFNQDRNALLRKLGETWAISYFEPGILPDDARLSVRLGKIMLGHLRHRDKRLGRLPMHRPRLYRDIGMLLRRSIGRFLQRSCRQIERDHERRLQEDMAKARQPDAA